MKSGADRDDGELHPLATEVAWGRLQSAVDEGAMRLVKTAFSPIIRETKDFCVMILNREGQSIVQSTVSIPAFIGTMPHTMQAMLAQRPLAQWSEGDALCTNDPWLGAGHLPDFNIAIPIFRHGALDGFVGVIAHMADIGGRGFVADARELYEEGLRIPVVPLRAGGRPNALLLDIIRANVRLPAQVTGDLEAMLAAGDYVVRRTRALLDAMPEVGIEAMSRRIHALCEAAMRAAIRELPDGDYANAGYIEADDADLKVAVTVRIRGDEIVVDYTGSSAQVARGINSTLGYTTSYSAYGLKCLLAPEVPINDGALRPITVTAPAGCLVNCTHPAAVAARSQVGHMLPSLIYGALAPASPAGVVADCGSPRPMVYLSGQDDAKRPFALTLFLHGGMGAGAESDGIACSAFPTNSAAVPTEIVELATPVLIEEKELVADSGGDGRRRGGLGQKMRLRVTGANPVRVSVLAQRARHPARGLFGGEDGAPTRVRLNGADGAALFKVMHLARGDVVEVSSPGGGGFGEPAGRPPALRASDRAAGYLSEVEVRDGAQGER